MTRNVVQQRISGVHNDTEKANIMITSHRRTDDEVREFDAPPGLTQNLEKVLVDLIELHLQGKQAHWNLVGTNFRVCTTTRRIVDSAREASDTIAERMRALNAVPDGRSDTVTASTTLPAISPAELSTTETVDLITTRIYAAVATIRAVHDDVDAADPSTSDLLHEMIDSLEKAAWMPNPRTGRSDDERSDQRASRKVITARTRR